MDSGAGIGGDGGASVSRAAARTASGLVAVLTTAVLSPRPHLTTAPPHHAPPLTTAQGGALLAAALRSNARLTELDLTNNQIGPAAGAKVLAAAADEEGMRRTLRTLKMGGNLLGDNKVMRGALCALVRSAPSRAHSRDSARAGGTPSKGVVASHPPALRTLHLEGNNLGARTAAPLSAALAESALTELDLSWNLLLPAGVEVLALALRAKASSLQTLKLGWNGAGPKGGLALGAMLSANSTLTSLELQHNNLDGVAAAVIAQAVQHDNRTLRTLELSVRSFFPAFRFATLNFSHKFVKELILFSTSSAILTTG